MPKRKASVEFGREVRRRRQALGWSLEQLAERAELTANYVGNVENGLHDASLSTIEKLAAALAAPPGALLGPPPVLSQKAREMGALFDQASPEVQDAIILILRSVSKA